MTGQQGILSKMQRKPKHREAFQNFFQPFSAHVPLVLMRLQAYGRNRYTRIQTSCNQIAVFVGEIKIIDKQCCLRVFLLGCRKDLPNQFYRPQITADPADGIIAAVDGHDDHFIDHIPHIHNAFEVTDLPLDAIQLFLQDGLVIILHKPVGTCGVPAQRMPLDPHTMLLQ